MRPPHTPLTSPHPIQLTKPHAQVLNTTATVQHSSRLPAGTTRAQALAMLWDHEFLIKCDPYLSKYERLPPAEAAKLNPPPCIPDNVKSMLRSQEEQPKPGSEPGQVKKDEEEGGEEKEEKEAVPICYRITDIIHAIPAGLWEPTVVSDSEITDIKDGLFVRLRSPLSVVMETFWQIKEVEGGGGLELAEEITIKCSRLLVGLVKKECESGWAEIHGKFIARLEGELKERCVW